MYFAVGGPSTVPPIPKPAISLPATIPDVDAIPNGHGTAPAEDGVAPKFGASREDSGGRQASSYNPASRTFVGGSTRAGRPSAGMGGVTERERRMSEREFVGMLRSLEVRARVLGGCVRVCRVVGDGVCYSMLFWSTIRFFGALVVLAGG